MSLTLNGKIAKILDLQLSYKTQTSDDLIAPEASAASDDINIVLKGALEW